MIDLLKNQRHFVFAYGLRLPQRAKMVDGWGGVLAEFFGFSDEGGTKGDKGNQEQPSGHCLGIECFVQYEVVGQEGETGKNEKGE